MSIAKSVAAIFAAGQPTATTKEISHNHPAGETNGSTEPPPSSPAKESTQLLNSDSQPPPIDPERENRTLNFVIKAPPKASFIKMIHKADNAHILRNLTLSQCVRRRAEKNLSNTFEPILSFLSIALLRSQTFFLVCRRF